MTSYWDAFKRKLEKCTEHLSLSLTSMEPQARRQSIFVYQLLGSKQESATAFLWMPCLLIMGVEEAGYWLGRSFVHFGKGKSGPRKRLQSLWAFRYFPAETGTLSRINLTLRGPCCNWNKHITWSRGWLSGQEMRETKWRKSSLLVFWAWACLCAQTREAFLHQGASAERWIGLLLFTSDHC